MEKNLASLQMQTKMFRVACDQVDATDRVEKSPTKDLRHKHHRNERKALPRRTGDLVIWPFCSQFRFIHFIDRIIHDDTDASAAPQNPSKEKDTSKKNGPPVLKYIKNHVRELFHMPMATIIKGAAILSEEYFIEALPAAWELLLETNQETAANSAALFIIASVRAPNFASDIMQRSLKHKDPDVRIGAILRYTNKLVLLGDRKKMLNLRPNRRYQVLWKCRFQVWPRMEENAHVSFKVPPPGIEFTLPSPKIGIESLPVVDPPWCPRQKTKDMEVTLNQERHVKAAGFLSGSAI